MHDTVPVTQALQDEGHVLPPDDDVDVPPLLVLLDGLMHIPELQVPPICVQSVHAPPPTPHSVSLSWPLLGSRQLLFGSQQPFAQVVLLHVAPPLELVELPESSPLSSPPLSSPVPLDVEVEVLVPYPLDP